MFLKKLILKKSTDDKNSMQNYPACKELMDSHNIGFHGEIRIISTVLVESSALSAAIFLQKKKIVELKLAKK